MNKRFNSKYTFLLILGIALIFAGIMPASASVDLNYFRTRNQTTYVLVEWQTASELDNLGFHIWRGTDQTLANAIQITSQLIPSKVAGQPIGADYEYEDRTVPQNVTYWYWLQDFDVNGSSKFHPSASGMAGDSGTTVNNTATPNNGGGVATSTSIPTSVSQQPTATRTPVPTITPITVASPTTQAITNTPTNQPPTPTATPIPATNTPIPASTSAPTNTATTVVVAENSPQTAAATVTELPATPTATLRTEDNSETDASIPTVAAGVETVIPNVEPTSDIVVEASVAEFDTASEIATIGENVVATPETIASDNAGQRTNTGSEENAGNNNTILISLGALLLVIITGGVALLSFITSRQKEVE